MLITVLDFVARSKRSKIARHDRLDSVCPRTIFFPTDDPFNSFSRVVRSSLLLLLLLFSVLCLLYMCLVCFSEDASVTAFQMPFLPNLK